MTGADSYNILKMHFLCSYRHTQAHTVTYPGHLPGQSCFGAVVIRIIIYFVGFSKSRGVATSVFLSSMICAPLRHVTTTTLCAVLC